ncbi:MAG: DUF2784 domain-containing protein [Gammaproteobacteria bacterium]|nr:DUF2784 domain-containing protein [Gammaproteobacteria bacterium]
MWQVLADLVLAAHAAYVLFVVGGQALIVIGWVWGWEWTRHLMFRLLHLAAIVLVMLEAWLGVHCPLTVLENLLRLKTGSTAYADSFINHWLHWMIFYNAPEWVFTLIYTVFTMLVVLTWLVYPPRGKLK